MSGENNEEPLFFDVAGFRKSLKEDFKDSKVIENHYTVLTADGKAAGTIKVKRREGYWQCYAEDLEVEEAENAKRVTLDDVAKWAGEFIPFACPWEQWTSKLSEQKKEG